MTTEHLKQRAWEFRKIIRAKAGLPCDWGKASPDMKAWYYELAKRSIEAEGKSPGS